jgi:HEAT repeat protein
MVPSTRSRPARTIGPLTWGTLLAGALVTLSIVAYRTWPAIRQWHVARTSIEALVDQNTQTQALMTLVDMGPDAAPYLVGALHHRNESVRTLASSVLSSLDPAELQGAITDLIAAMHDPCAQVRINSAKTLARLGTFGSERMAVHLPQTIAALSSNVEHEELERATEDDSPAVREAAALALRTIRESTVSSGRENTNRNN